VPQRVINAVTAYMTSSNANTDGAFATSQEIDQLIANARSALADLLGCDAAAVVLGPNITTLTFAFSRAFGRAIVAGDEIIVTRLDHDANVAPWQALAGRGATVKLVDIKPQSYTLDLDGLQRTLSSRTRLIAVTHASKPWVRFRRSPIFVAWRAISAR
jgi:selenocysteine lyase/cysteine desulfurase